MVKFEQNLVDVVRWKVKYVYNEDVLREELVQGRKTDSPRLSRGTPFHLVRSWARKTCNDYTSLTRAIAEYE